MRWSIVDVQLSFFLDTIVGNEKRRYSCEKVVLLSREPEIGEDVQVSVKLTDGSLRLHLVTIKSPYLLIEGYKFSRYKARASKELIDYLSYHLTGDTGWQINET